MLWDHLTSSVIFFELPCHFSKTPLKRNKLFCFGKDEPSVRGQQAQNLRGNRQLRKRKIGKTNQRKIDYEAHDQLHVASHFGSFHFFSTTLETWQFCSVLLIIYCGLIKIVKRFRRQFL